MSKILVWVGGSVFAFILLVAGIFAMLTFLDPIEEVENIPQEVKEAAGIDTRKQTKIELDSLNAVITDLRSQIFFNKIAQDSLTEQLTFKTNLIDGYQNTIDGLNRELTEQNSKQGDIKDLAKTFESMKVNEIKPILENVDDNTVINIYKNMSTRNRKNILNALTPQRAAAITEKLAGGG